MVDAFPGGSMMKSVKFKLLSTTATPLAAVAALAVGMTTPAAAAGSGCGTSVQSVELPEAKARNGEITLAMSHEKKAPCAPNPCAAKDEAMGKAKDAAEGKAKEMANPCAAKPTAPCAPKSQ
jgi:hypothetical protein